MYHVRAVAPQDEAFIANTFLESIRDSEDARGMGNGEFYPHFKAELSALLAHCHTLVAYPDGSPDEIAGWLAFRGTFVGWCYTKRKPWRRTGAMRKLFEVAGIKPGTRITAIYDAPRAFQLASSVGYQVKLLSHVQAMAILLGGSRG